jgi:transcriptional regulator with XRE-family HTH domain
MASTVSRINAISRRKLRKAISYQGIFARVAERLGVSRGHVYNVAAGERESTRVAEALLAEMERIERKCAA